jgi:NCAIR mutase (PurE)-related protein
VIHPDAIRTLLDAVAQGTISPDVAFKQLKYLDFEPIEDFAKVDHHRPLRTGFPEVVWGPGKTVDQIVQIMRSLHQHSPVVMATRILPRSV